MPEVHAALRYAVFGLVVLAALVALGSWLVRSRRVSPFGVLGRTLRTATDPIIRPVERRLVQLGGNPAHAGGWLVIVTAIAGIVFLSLVGWVLTTALRLRLAASGGPRAVAFLLVQVVYSILILALIVRVIASWFGLYRYSRWIRPAYVLTDWIVEPLHRVLPPFGGLDVSPLVAWFLLWILRQLIVSIL